MPIITVYGLPNIAERKLTDLYERILSGILEVENLHLKKEDITVFFPPDKMDYGLGIEIIVFVDGLFEKPERTEEVRNRLAEKIGKEIRQFFLINVHEKPPIKLPKLIEVFIRSFNPRMGFWSSADK